MNSQQLFMELLHRLRGYSDTTVLHALLQQRGDEKECKTSATEMASRYLNGSLSRIQVKRAFNRLASEGLIEVRTQPSYRTYIKVNRDAVDALLREPINPNLPGMSTGSFPYIEHLAAAA
ncbi:MAG: hypothetical protein IKX21_07075 [Deltaproteobacteria bacterium]|nr:hypothetical protein [Deltaproteobacteria bacterium]